MSRIAIVGANGALGRVLTQEALTRDLRVNAVTRDATKLHAANENLSVYQADADTGEGLAAALKGCRFIVSTVGSERPSDCVGNIVRVAAPKKVDKLVFVSRLGGTQPHGVKAVFSKFGAGKQKAQAVQHDLGVALDLVRLSGLNYVVLNVAALSDEAPGRRLGVTDVGVAGPSAGVVGRADLARFILSVLEDPAWSCREVQLHPHG